jgi:hypothetical protein
MKIIYFWSFGHLSVLFSLILWRLWFERQSKQKMCLHHGFVVSIVPSSVSRSLKSSWHMEQTWPSLLPLAMACLTISADCSCSRTPGSSLAAAHCSDLCSCTPGSSLAMACLTVSADCSSSRTPGYSLAAARCSDLCSCTPGSSLAMARLTVSADCSCSRTPGSSLAAARCSDSCSCTPGSSLAIARLTVLADCSCSRTPGSSLAAASCSEVQVDRR